MKKIVKLMNGVISGIIPRHFDAENIARKDANTRSEIEKYSHLKQIQLDRYLIDPSFEEVNDFPKPSNCNCAR